EPLSIKKFVERKGLKEYKGIRGFDNLMLLLKADIRSLFRDHSIVKSSAKTKARINSINQVLLPYKDHWDEWTVSNFCSLTEMEVRAINYYKINYSHKQMAEHFNLPYNLVYTHYRNALRTLKSPGTISEFQGWLNAKEKTPEQEFLDAPIIGLRSLMSTRLCFALARIETTIRIVLEKHSVNELLQYRGIGNTSIDELKTILKEHNCLSLLREK
ncbi:MAG TPA: hypothetical protein VLB84_21195, partial [Bacteroidia bacterium]|nr:hypothetical protein [Bacteroidia bacterium]